MHFDQDPSASCFFPDVLQQSGKQCSLFLAFVEIYNNNVYDLLGPSMQSSENVLPAKQGKTRNMRMGKGAKNFDPREALQVGEDAQHNTYVKELRWVQAANSQEALELVAFAQKNMTFASTFFNMNSSRSHVICFLRLVHWNLRTEIDDSIVSSSEMHSYSEEHGHQILEAERSSVMSICDLAGSERQPASGHQLDRLREAGSINTDLLHLGQCLTGMHNNQVASRKLAAKHKPEAGAAAVVAKKRPIEEPVPYRSCRLTYLLKAFLVGGRARVAMISAIVPTVELIEQNMQVLRYAAFASEVVVYRKLEPAQVEKFQAAKQKQQSKAVAKAARRLSQAPRHRALLASAKKATSEGTPIAEELAKISEEMGDALDAQLLVGNVNENTNDEFDDDDDGSSCEEESSEEEDDEEKVQLLEMLEKVANEAKRLQEENTRLLHEKEAAENDAKRQRNCYEMMKDKYKEAMDELTELENQRPSVDAATQVVDELPPRMARNHSAVLPRQRSGLINALTLAEPSFKFGSRTELWEDDETDSNRFPRVEKRKIIEETADDSDSEEGTPKKSRLEAPTCPGTHTIAPHIDRNNRNNASPSPMPINKFSTHTKASILRMRMHQSNVVKERQNTVNLKTPVLQPTNPEDLSLDEPGMNMPAELQRRLEQIQMLKQQLEDLEEEKNALEDRLEEMAPIDKMRKCEEYILKLKADVEFEKQLSEQNAEEAENVRVQNMELAKELEMTRNREHSVSEELTRRVGEIGQLKERISELQQDLQSVYEELNSSKARENETAASVEQLQQLQHELEQKEAILKLSQMESDQLKVRIKELEQKIANLVCEKERLLEEQRMKKQEKGETTMMVEELQFDVDEAVVEAEQAKKEVKIVENENEDLKRKIESISKEYEENQSALALLQRDQNAKTKEITELKQEIADLQALNRKLSQDVEKTKVESEEKSNEIVRLNNELESLRKTLTKAESEIEKIKSVSQNNLDKMSALTEELSLLQQAKKEAEVEMEAIKNENKALRNNEIASRDEQLSEKVARIEELEQIKGKLEATIEQVTADLKQKETSESEFETNLKNRTADFEHLMKRFRNVEAELIEARQEIDRLKSEFDNERSILTKQGEEDANKILEEKSRQCQALQLQCSDAEQTIKNLREQIRQLTSDNAEKIAALEEEYLKKTKANSLELVEFKKESAVLIEKIAKDHLEKLNSIENQLQTTSTKFENCRERVLSLKQCSKKISNLESRCQALTEHRDAMEEALNGRIKGLEADLKDKDNDIARLRRDRDAARDKEEKSLRLADEKEQEVVDLNQQVEDLNKRLIAAGEKMDKNLNNNEKLAKDYEDMKQRCEELEHKVSFL